MKIKPKSLDARHLKRQLHFPASSNNHTSNSTGKSSELKQNSSSLTKQQKKQPLKNQTIKRQPPIPTRIPSKSTKINNNTQIKLEPSDIRYIDRIVQEKHGQILTHQEMTSLRKKMVKQNFTESNPYNELNYNTGQRNQWRDNKKKHLSDQDLKKLKTHFLHIINIVNKGQRAKYTLRDMMSEFNLDQSAFLQIKRQFQTDPEIFHHLKKYSNKSNPSKQSSQILQIIKKRQILNKILSKNPLLTINQLALKIARHTKTQNYFPDSQIAKLIQTQGYNWRPIFKYPESRNFEANLKRKKKFCEQINFILTESNCNVYFLGVMNFNSFMFRAEGWTKEEYLISPTIDESFSLVALTERSGEGTWKFQKHIYKEEVFEETCRTLFDQLFSDSNEPKYLAIDFRLHKYQKTIKKSRRKKDVQIVWIPPFSYNLNPLEFWFEDIKDTLGKSQNIIKLRQPIDLSERKNEFLIKDIYNDLKQIFTEKYNTMFDFSGFFEMAAQYHKKALQMIPF